MYFKDGNESSVDDSIVEASDLSYQSNDEHESNNEPSVNDNVDYFCSETGETAKKEANLLANLIGRSGANDNNLDDNNVQTFDIWMDMDEVDLSSENQDEERSAEEDHTNSTEELPSSFKVSSLQTKQEPIDLTQSSQIDRNADWSYLDKVRDEMTINIKEDCSETSDLATFGDDLLSLVDSSTNNS